MTMRWASRAVVVGMCVATVLGSGAGSTRAESATDSVSRSLRAPSFVPLTPARVLDTRSGSKVGDAAGTAAALEVSLLGKGGLPATGVAAVSLNVTVTEGENPAVGGGFVTVFPCGVRPDASNLNFTAGQTVPNAVIAPVSAGGTVCFYVYGTAHLLADVSGYFPTGSDFSTLTPARVLDTRATGKVGNATGSGAPLELSVLGKGGVPGSGVGAVALNVTVAEGENPVAGGGYVTVFPCGVRPNASSLNFVAGQTVPNLVIAPVSSAGKICLYVYGTAHLLADVSGYVPVGSDFVSLTPARLVNTRDTAKVSTGAVLEVSVLGRAGLPGTEAGVPVIGALSLNVTVTDTENPAAGGGYVTVFPCGTRPDASNLNFVAGQTIANAVIAPISAAGTICFYVYGTAHLLADVSGYFPTTNVVRFKVVDEAGNLLAKSGVVYCDTSVVPLLFGGCTSSLDGSQSPDGFIRVAIAPDRPFQFNGYARDLDWPCPFITETGFIFHFSPPFSSLGADVPSLSTLIVHKPDPSEC